MKLIPKYSYEFNCILNPDFNEVEQVKNFASLISDKDRFLILLSLIEENRKLIEERLDYNLPENVEFYIVRAERFKSFSEPITIEYSLLPEEMLLFLLKEILKLTITDRFPDELIREQYINSFVDYICVNGNFQGYDFVKFGVNLHDESKNLHSNYEFKDIDFKDKTMKQHLEELYK